MDLFKYSSATIQMTDLVDYWYYQPLTLIRSWLSGKSEPIQVTLIWPCKLLIKEEVDDSSEI